MRITVCGEALIDLFQSPNPDERLSSLGGSPLNTAVALGKLGESVSFLGRLGDDHYADELMTHLETNGVDTSLVVRVTEPIVARSPEFRFLIPTEGLGVVPKAGTALAQDGDQVWVTPYDNAVLVMPSVTRA